jgi:prepilin-type N-terminal cleavage/methylation domain-containing protein/prepilin-type processing-associated H-X9-DG protein
MMKRAFTLIELLVVIAIIAILAAILFPVFAQAKMAAKKAVDISNMKQISLCVLMYMNDNDDKSCQVSWEVAPSIGPGPSNDVNGYQVHFTYLLQPYVKNYAIFIAPGDPTPNPPAHPCPNGSADFGKFDSSGQQYCDWQYPNSYLPAYNVMPAHDWLPVASTTFPTPANMIEWADKRFVSGDGTTHYSGKKGLDGFNPSQPCTQEGATFDPTISSQYVEQISSSTTSYGFWNAASILWWQNNMAGGDDPNVDRVWYDLYSGVSNYGFADGHAKTLSLGATLVDQPGSYMYGDTFYPSINPQDGTCVGGG